MAKNTKTDVIDFEKSLEQLTKLVEKMEGGKLPLEESLQVFEQGVGLIRHCQQALKEAEQRVQILTAQQNLEPYSNESSE